MLFQCSMSNVNCSPSSTICSRRITSDARMLSGFGTLMAEREAQEQASLFRARRGELLAEGGAGAGRRERVLIQIEPEVERHQDFVVVASVLL